MANKLCDELRMIPVFSTFNKNVVLETVALIERLTSENAQLNAIVDPLKELCNDKTVSIHGLFSGSYVVRVDGESYRETALAGALEIARNNIKNTHITND